jgi:3D (Asp-Asp-Asp) domain-containing protein
MKGILYIFCMTILLCGSVEARAPRPESEVTFLATAYAQRGITKSGAPAQCGVVAADTRVLPLGTEIQVINAGEYSGTYTIADTGSKVRGHHIDIFITESSAERSCRSRFCGVAKGKRGDSPAEYSPTN